MSHLTGCGLRVAFSILLPFAVGSIVACGTDDAVVASDGSTREHPVEAMPDGTNDIGRETAPSVDGAIDLPPETTPDVPVAPDTIDAPADHAGDLAEPVLGVDAPVLGVDASSGGEAGSGRGTLALVAGSTHGAGYLDGVGTAASFVSPRYVTSDGAGNLFVTDDTYCIRKIDTPTGKVTTLAGSPTLAGSVDGPGADARFAGPTGLACDDQGNLFVGDVSSIRKIVVSTGMVSTVARWSGSPRRDINPDFDFLTLGIAWDGGGALFVADAGMKVIRRVELSTGDVTTFAGSELSASIDGIGTAAAFRSPIEIVSDRVGHLYIVDCQSRYYPGGIQGNDTIRRLDIATRAVTTLAVGKLFQPAGLAVDGQGRLFVVEHSQSSIRQIDLPTGQNHTLTGNPNPTFVLPWGLAADGAGHLYVADTGNQAIRRVDLDTSAVATIAGSPLGNQDADGVKNTASFSFANARALVNDGTSGLLVVGDGSHVRRVSPETGEVATLPGLAVSGCNATGDGMGNLFVADCSGYGGGGTSIYRATIAAEAVSLLAGGRTAEDCNYQQSDGTGPKACFTDIRALTSDGSGRLFVVDNSNLRQLVVDSGEVTTLTGADGSRPAIGYPSALAYDGAGGLFILNPPSELYRFDLGSRALSTIVHATSTDAGWTSPFSSTARHLAVDRAGDVFVDAGPTVVRVRPSTGELTTVVGTAGAAWFSVGPLPATLSYVAALAVGSSGELYILDGNRVLVARF
jgi:streptogramin lyase